jgi:hypothetical protein
MDDDAIVERARRWLAGTNPDDAIETADAFARAVVRLADERDAWKKRAAQHGCDVDNGDRECG